MKLRDIAVGLSVLTASGCAHLELDVTKAQKNPQSQSLETASNRLESSNAQITVDPFNNTFFQNAEIIKNKIDKCTSEEIEISNKSVINCDVNNRHN